VRADLLRAAKFLVLATLALVFVAVFLPGRLELAARIYALALCGLVLMLAIAALRRAYPPATALRPKSRRRAERRRPPPTLARIEQETALGVAGSFDLHHHLRPRLRAIAGALLGTRRGVSLDGDPERARRLLGDETWELVRRDRPPPEDRLARGLPPSTLGHVVDSLERI